MRRSIVIADLNILCVTYLCAATMCEITELKIHLFLFKGFKPVPGNGKFFSL